MVVQIIFLHLNKHSHNLLGFKHSHNLLGFNLCASVSLAVIYSDFTNILFVIISALQPHGL